MSFSYLKHEFMPDVRNSWYKCTKCNIKYYCGEFVTGFAGFSNYNRRIDLDNMTCDEVIIKNIIE